jgi:hypothetical protein
VDKLTNLKECFRVLFHLSIDKHFENGDMDGAIEAFKLGDSLEVHLSVKAVPNDIIWANMLDGHLTPEIYQDILNLKIKRDSKHIPSPATIIEPLEPVWWRKIWRNLFI